MGLNHVRRFYGELKGWNMFDTQFLTKPMSEYLQRESQELGHMFESPHGYTHLVEVGCGYGRYMEWAVSSTIAYDGVDIVDWMVSMGEIKAQELNVRFPNVHCAVHLHAAEQLSSLLDNSLLEKRQTRTIAFFPFNSFGNVSSPQEVMRSLYRDRLDVVISTFKSDARSTELRKQYYSNCGYTNLECTLNKHGLLITSDEGFRAFAYGKDVLIDMFARNGFELVSYTDVGEIGAMYHFRPLTGKRAQLMDPRRQSMRRYPRYRAHLHASLSVLNDSGGGPDAQLLSFTRVDAVTHDISADGVSFICHGEWLPGSRAKIDLRHGSTGHSLNFVGVVTRCEPRENGNYLLAVKFFKPAETTINDLFNLLNQTRLAS